MDKFVKKRFFIHKKSRKKKLYGVDNARYPSTHRIHYITKFKKKQALTNTLKNKKDKTVRLTKTILMLK